MSTAVQQHENGHDDSTEHSFHNTYQQGDHEGDQHNHKITPVAPLQFGSLIKLDQSQHRHNDDGTQYSQWKIIKEGSKKHQGQSHEDCRVNGRQDRTPPGLAHD